MRNNKNFSEVKKNEKQNNKKSHTAQNSANSKPKHNPKTQQPQLKTTRNKKKG